MTFEGRILFSETYCGGLLVFLILKARIKVEKEGGGRACFFRFSRFSEFGMWFQVLGLELLLIRYKDHLCFSKSAQYFSEGVQVAQGLLMRYVGHMYIFHISYILFCSEREQSTCRNHS